MALEVAMAELRMMLDMDMDIEGELEGETFGAAALVVPGTTGEVGPALSLSGQTVVETSSVTTWVEGVGMTGLLDMTGVEEATGVETGMLEDAMLETTWLEEAGTLEIITGPDVGPAEGLSVSGQMVVDMSVVTTSVELGMGTAGMLLDATWLDEAAWLEEAGMLETMTGAEVGPAEGLSVSGQMVVLMSVVMT